MGTTPHIPAPLTRDITARLAYHGHPDSPALVRVRTWEQRERAARALRALATCWALALIAVFLPVLHFVLVPSLLVAGPLVAALRLREAHTVQSATGECPVCHEAQAFALSGAWRETVLLRCEKCGRAIELRAPALEFPG